MKFKLQLTLIIVALAVLIGAAAGCGTTPKDTQPIINSFITTPAGINAGERTVLSWDVFGATEINIQPGIGKVGPSGTLLLTPPDTITYTLTATNSAGSTASSATVTVTPVIAGKPDLVVTDMWLIGSLVNYKIANLGDADSKGSEAYFYINDLKLSDDWVEPLAVGEERSTSFSNFNWNFAGIIPVIEDPAKRMVEFNVKACVDAENEIEESNEGNNCLIEIWGPPFTYNFAEKAHLAEWRNADGKLLWPVMGNSGSVYLPPGDIVIICPPKASNAWIQARFADFYSANFWSPTNIRELQIPLNAKFVTTLSLMGGNPTDSVSFAMGYLDEAGSLVLFPKTDVSKGEAARVYELDLSELAGEKTELFFRIQANGGPIEGCLKLEKPMIVQY